MLDVVVWWLVVQLLGLAALPIALVALRYLPDRGYAFAKPLGLLLAGYIFWLLGFAHVLPTNRGGWLIAIAIVAAIAGLVLRRHLAELRAWVSENRRRIVFIEAVFTLGFLLWAVVRAYNPEIAGTEKPMDFAFINGILRSEGFPPVDPWLAGHSISYYYFGHLLIAGLIDLSGVSPAVGFNLALATIFGLAAIGAVSLGSNIVRLMGGRERAALATGLLAALLLLGVSNLQGAAELLRTRGLGTAELWQWVGVNGALEPTVSSTWYPSEGGWWWWRATRVINTLSYERDAAGQIVRVDDRADYTITEFPFFSFLLGDLHPHVIALPFGLLALALALNVLADRAPPSRVNLRSRAPEFVLAILALGALGFLNSWDFPTYGAIYLLALAASIALAGRAIGSDAGDRSERAPAGWRAALERWWEGGRSDLSERSDSALGQLALAGAGPHGPTATPPTEPLARSVKPAGETATSHAAPETPCPDSAHETPWSTATEGARLGDVWRAVWPLGLLVVLGGVVLYLPFYATFRTQASGILPVLGPGSRWIHLLLVWGLFIVPVGLLLAAGYRRGALGRRVGWLLLPLLPLIAWSAIVLAIGREWSFVVERWIGSAPILVIAAAALALFADRALRRDDNRGLTFALLLVTIAGWLILGCELFFIRDVFGNRMNTVFKLYYQSWVLLALAGSGGIYCALAALWKPPIAAAALRLAGVGIFTVLLVGALYYPAAATYTKTGRFRAQPTLDGLAYVQRSTPGEYDAVAWLQRNVRGPTVIVEAVGGQYSDFGRISARTGLPTLLGWAGHEVQWRGSDALFRGRDAEVDQIYRSTDVTAVSTILRKYGVQYIIVGVQERSKYGPTVGQNFEGFMDVAYRNPDVTIYRVRA